MKSALNERINFTRARIARYREAEDAILTAQSYSMDGMTLTRADLGKVQDMRAKLESELETLIRKSQGTSRSRVRVAIPTERFCP